MFYKVIRTKQDLSYISLCSLSILYNSKSILMATSLGTNAVVVTRVHCNLLVHFYSLQMLMLTYTFNDYIVLNVFFFYELHKVNYLKYSNLSTIDHTYQIFEHAHLTALRWESPNFWRHWKQGRLWSNCSVSDRSLYCLLVQDYPNILSN